MIGTTRETVTRILSALKRRNLVTVHGATMYVECGSLLPLKSVAGAACCPAGAGNRRSKLRQA